MREKKIVKELSKDFGLNNWKNCVAINGDGKAGGGTDLESEGDANLVIIIISALPPSWD